jgi:hypothetical protein
MTETLKNFLVDLASDSGHMTGFTADPADGLARWAPILTDEEKAVILSGDAERLRRALVSAQAPTAGGGAPTAAKKRKRSAKKQAPKKKPRRRPGRKKR